MRPRSAASCRRRMSRGCGARPRRARHRRHPNAAPARRPTTAASPPTTATRSSTTPCATSAGAKGISGGATHTHQRALGRARERGERRQQQRQLAAAEAADEDFDQPARGQPPPGSAHRARQSRWAGLSRRAALRPRQMAGCSSNRASASIVHARVSCNLSSRPLAGNGASATALIHMSPAARPRRTTPTTMPSISSGSSFRST